MSGDAFCCCDVSLKQDALRSCTSLPRGARCGKQSERVKYLSRNSRCCTPSAGCKCSRSRPTIPVTICEQIIDFVAEDRPCCWFQVRQKEVSDTLKACSLVARSWAPRSQYHLFRVLKVDLSPGAPPTEVLYGIPVVRERVEAVSVGASADRPALYRAAFQLPSLLDRIRHLQLCDGVFYLPPGPRVDICFRKFITVTELSLCRVTFHTAQDMRRLISAMPSVEKLAISDLRWAPNTFPDRPLAGDLLSHSTPIRLRQLVVHTYASWVRHRYSKYIFAWLAQSGAFINLNRAFIHVKTSDELGAQCISTLEGVFHALRSSPPGANSSLFFVLDFPLCRCCNPHLLKSLHRPYRERYPVFSKSLESRYFETAHRRHALHSFLRPIRRGRAAQYLIRAIIDISGSMNTEGRTCPHEKRSLRTCLAINMGVTPTVDIWIKRGAYAKCPCWPEVRI